MGVNVFLVPPLHILRIAFLLAFEANKKWGLFIRNTEFLVTLYLNPHGCVMRLSMDIYNKVSLFSGGFRVNSGGFEVLLS